MTYEEKLATIVTAIVEARKATRKGHYPKLYLTSDNGLNKIGVSEVYDILLQLRDDEKVIHIKELPTELKRKLDRTVVLEPDRDNFVIVIRGAFDGWYSAYLLKTKSRLENLTYINLVKIYDVVLDINDKLQISKTPEIFINQLPNLVKFQILFPVDSVGTRKAYEGYRWEGVRYLEKEGILANLRHTDDAGFGYGYIEMWVDVPKFEAFLKQIEGEYIKRNKAASKESKQKEVESKAQPVPEVQSQPNSHYDERTSTLHIRQEKVKLRKNAFNTSVIALLTKSSQNMKKDWCWDEVIQKLEGTDDESTLQEFKKKFRPACDGLAKIIALKTGITDYLIYDNNNVRINPTYQ